MRQLWELYALFLISLIRALVLIEGRIKSFPYNSALEYTPKLNILFFSPTRLVFRELENLKFLNLSDNILTMSHQNAFENTKQLTDISLENNRLSFADEKTPFMHVYSLEILDLSQNGLTRIPNLLKLNNLKEVILYSNEISSVSFSEIQQYFISFDGMYEIRPTFGHSNTRIYLDGQSLQYDCGMSDFLLGTDQKQLASVFSRTYLQTENDHQIENACDPDPNVNVQCTTECSCGQMIDYTRTIKMSCNSKKLTKLSKIEFIYAKLINLDISNNSLN